MLTQERLKQVLSYDPETGEFRWIANATRSDLVGTRAGSRSIGGIQIGVDGGSYLAHRLAYLYMTGAWPPEEIDHRDTDRFNNRWSNLRPAARADNQCNVGLRANNTSGFKGVAWNRRAKRWMAYISYAHRRYHLGYFDTAEAAYGAYCAAAIELHGQFARVA